MLEVLLEFLIGYMENCINSSEANITGKSYCGGIVGVLDTTGEMKNCNNYGKVNGESFFGDIVGKNNGRKNIKYKESKYAKN